MRVLLVGGVPKRRHQGPVSWGGHRFEMIPHSFDRIVRLDLAAENDRAVVDPGRLEAFVDSTRGYDAVFCESPEALMLVHERRKAGDPPFALLALEVHGLKRVEAMREWYRDQEGCDPWPAMLKVPWISWIAASSVQCEVLRDSGVPADRIHRIDAGTVAYSTFLPNADALLDGGPEADGAAAEGLPVDGVVVPGSGRRDPECHLRAAQLLPDLPFTVVDEQAGHHQMRLAGTGLLELPNVQWREALPLESYIALLKRARLVVVALQPGAADGGHTTVALAHRLGAAVICSNVPGIVDYVEDGVNARLVKPGDPGDLASAIRSLWDDTETRRRLARNARETEAARAHKCQAGFLHALESAVAALPGYGEAAR